MNKNNFNCEVKHLFINGFPIGTTRNQHITDLPAEQLSHVIRGLVPFTEHMVSVSAFTIMGEGPPTVLSVRTREQGKNVFPLKELPDNIALAHCNIFSLHSYSLFILLFKCQAPFKL